MHALVELIATLVAALAAAAFAQFGIELQPSKKEEPKEPEVHRTVHGQQQDAPEAAALIPSEDLVQRG